MQLKVNGKPYIYTIECSRKERGRQLTDAEIHDFLVDCIIESFEKKGTKVIRHTPDFNSGVDFSYTKIGKTVCGIVAYFDKNDIDDQLHKFYEENLPRLNEGYDKHGSIPIIYFAEIKCLDTEDGDILAGGRYENSFHPQQIRYKSIPMRGDNVSEFEMYMGYANSWGTGNVTFLKDYVKDNFHGISDLAFDEITSKEELLAHVALNHESYKTRNISICPMLVIDKDSGDKGILIRLDGKDKCFVTLEFDKFRISKSHTHQPPTNYEEWLKGYELYGTHGDHHAPFVDDADLLTFVKDMLEDSKLCLKLDTEVVFDDANPVTTRVAALKYMGDEEIDDTAYLALLAYNPTAQTNVFVSCYPYLKGVSIFVEIIDVLEWENNLEATIKCRYKVRDDEFHFHFFATDYFFNKKHYKIGNRIEISLVASSGNAKEASKGFTFEGQKAIDFLTKMGKRPTYDANGEVEPVKFSTENLVAFLPHDDKCPDMAEFQSPTKELVYDSFYNNSVNRCLIKLHNDPDLEVPLYFNDDFAPKNGELLCGWLWLSGRLSDPCGTMDRYSPTKMANNLMLSDISESFLNEIGKLKYRSVIDFSPVLNVLPDISIPKGKSLFAIRLGNSSRYSYELFLANFSELVALQGFINPNGFIDGVEEDKVSEYMLKTQFGLLGKDRSAVWQAFLLSIMGKFMPYSKTYSWEFSYILTKEEAEKSSNAMHGKILAHKLLPTFSKDKCDSGYFTVFAWDAGELRRLVYTYIINNGVIRFLLDESYLVIDTIDYFSDESNILFRDGN